MHPTPIAQPQDAAALAKENQVLEVFQPAGAIGCSCRVQIVEPSQLSSRLVPSSHEALERTSHTAPRHLAGEQYARFRRRQHGGRNVRTPSLLKMETHDHSRNGGIWQAPLEALMLVVLRLLIACVVLVFYLPVISGVALAIIDAAGWLPGTLTNWWKDIGDMIAEGAGLSASYKANMFTLWGIAALLTVIGHTLFSLARVRD